MATNKTEYNAEKNNYVTRYWDTKDGEYKTKTTTYKPDDPDDSEDAARYAYENPNTPYPNSEKAMSNKFLPFVVEKSTPLHMFKTLLARSKGMNQVLVASTFHLILKVNIKKLREEVKELPEMPLEKLYEELLIKRPAYRVQDDVLASFQNIFQFFPACDYWNTELKNYSASDAMLFFCSMSYARLSIEDYTEYPYNLIMDGEALDEILTNIKRHVMFSDKGVDVQFDDPTQLRCYILYHSLFRELMEPDAVVDPINATMTQAQP